MIGKDNAEGVIRSWVFQSDGGFGGGVWTRDGKKWSVDVHGVRADGRELTATIIYVQVDPDTVTWQAVNQSSTACRSRTPSRSRSRNRSRRNSQPRTAGERVTLAHKSRET